MKASFFKVETVFRSYKIGAAFFPCFFVSIAKATTANSLCCYLLYFASLLFFQFSLNILLFLWSKFKIERRILMTLQKNATFREREETEPIFFPLMAFIAKLWFCFHFAIVKMVLSSCGRMGGEVGF